MSKDLHPIQLHILKKLVFADGLRYTELKPTKEMENNQFDFHLNQLIRANYVEKHDSVYKLTTEGKKFSGRIDTERMNIAKQAKISITVCCTKRINNKTYFLIYTRLKHPFYGCQGFMAGKLLYGETIIEGAKRELKEETNLEGEPLVVSLRHYKVIDSNTNLLVDDKFMFVCLVKNPTGELIPNEEGDSEWVEEKEIKKYITKPFETIEDFMEVIKQTKIYKGSIIFQEIDHYTTNF